MPCQSHMKFPFDQLVREHLHLVPSQRPPQPWRYVGRFLVADLVSVGFDERAENLLIITNSEQIVIDCIQGKQIFRGLLGDRISTSERVTPATGTLAGKTVFLLNNKSYDWSQTTFDRWHCVFSKSPNGLQQVGLIMPIRKDQHRSMNLKNLRFAKIAWQRNIVTAGFSPSGRTLIVASDHDVAVYSRCKAIACSA